MDFEDIMNFWIKSLSDIDSVLEEITNKDETQKFLIDTLQDQLFATGEDGNGVSLGEYSPVTVRIKRAKGDPTDRITLLDTGAFYESYFITPFKGGFFIDADGKKESTNLFVRYGDDILKPNQESLILISDYYESALIEYFTDVF